MDPDQPPSQPSNEPSMEATPAKLKIAGAWSGVLEVRLDEWTVPMLRAEVSRRSNGSHPPECINLISAGKILRDGDEGPLSTLQHLGLKNNAKILASAVSPAASDHVKALEAEAASEAERSQRLSRIRAAAEKLAARHATSSLPVEDYNIELEDQSGQKVKLGSETNQRVVMMGLMLHANAKRLIKEQKYKDALDVLAIGEDAFSLCDPKVIEMIDNVPILEIDTVWCYFMLRDISWLSMAGVRLAKARKGFERSHGKDSTRFRLLQAGHHTEIAIYLRLELLEGVVAYHCGRFEQSRKALTAAQAKYFQLQVPDEALSLLMGMGYKERSAKRALRMTNQDVQSAVDFLVEERAKKIRRRQEDIQRGIEIVEQKGYGTTPQGKAVDLQRLNELVSIGFERRLAAEALRVNENDIQNALDDLTNPETNSKLQLCIDRPKEAQPSPADNQGNDDIASIGTESGPSGAVNDDMDERDAEMEAEIANELTGDPLADYDNEVTQEGEAITEYLALLESTAYMVNGSH